MDYQPQMGDIIFVDSNSTGAKVVKFFMTAPSFIDHLIRKILNDQEKVEYYHPLVAISETACIEQQWKVETSLIDKIFDDKFIVFRRVDGKINHVDIAKREIGQLWGVLNTLLGKFPTWLTTIELFNRYLKLPNEEVSANRVARWLYKAYGETFGFNVYWESTTHTMVKWMVEHPEIYKMVYKQEKQ